MSLNPPSGNMFKWADTGNPWGGVCCDPKKKPLRPVCVYCYRKKSFFARMEKYQGPVRLCYDEENPLPSWASPKSGVIWPGSMIDAFAPWIPSEEIEFVLAHANKFYQHWYLFLSKFPMRYPDFEDKFPPKTILGTTIETNRSVKKYSSAPHPQVRASVMKDSWFFAGTGFKKMLSIEPIMDFDLNKFSQMIIESEFDFISIGANTYPQVRLPQPEKAKVRELINIVRPHTEVRLKDNITRLGFSRREVRVLAG